VAAVVAVEVVAELLRSPELPRSVERWSPRSVQGRRQVELLPELGHQVAQRCWKETKTPQVWLDLRMQVQSALQAALPVRALRTCSCILYRKAVRQEAEGRRVQFFWT
jgi:hypothetical protein